MTEIASKATVSEATINAKLKEIAAHRAAVIDGEEWIAAARRVLGHKLPQQHVTVSASAVGTLEVASSAKSKTKAAGSKTKAPRAPRGTGFTAQVEAVVNGSSGPMSKADLKAFLKNEGVPANKLGPYFYTTLSNLVKAGRIVKNADGSVSRVAQAHTANGSVTQAEAQSAAA